MSGHPKLIVRVRYLNPQNLFDWYVDSVIGDDTNFDGRSPDHPYATIAKVQPLIQESDKVGLSRGSEWREQFTVTKNAVAVEAYGTGADPILRCDEIVTSGWSKTGGFTNIYQFTKTVDFLVAYGGFQSVWEDDVRLPLVANQAACDATPGSYYVAAHNTTTPTIFVHASDSGDPSANGKIYEYAKRNFGFMSYGYVNVTLKGVDCRRNLSESGSIRIGRSSMLAECYAREGNKHNIYYEDGCVLFGVQALDAYYNGSQTLFVYNENTPIGMGIIHFGCIADADSDGSAPIAGTTGFYGHKNVSGDFGNVIYESCIAKRCYSGFEPGNCNGILNSCTIEEVSIAVRNQDNITLNDCDFLNAIINAIEIGMDDKIVTVNGGTLSAVSATMNAAPIIVGAGITGATLVMDGVTLRAEPSGSFYAIYALQAGFTINVQRCTFPYAHNNVYRLLADAVITSDYNNLKVGAGFRVDATTYTIAQWQLLGHDTHSVVT